MIRPFQNLLSASWYGLGKNLSEIYDFTFSQLKFRKRRIFFLLSLWILFNCGFLLYFYCWILMEKRKLLGWFQSFFPICIYYYLFTKAFSIKLIFLLLLLPVNMNVEINSLNLKFKSKNSIQTGKMNYWNIRKMPIKVFISFWGRRYR